MLNQFKQIKICCIFSPCQFSQGQSQAQVRKEEGWVEG